MIPYSLELAIHAFEPNCTHCRLVSQCHTHKRPQKAIARLSWPAALALLELSYIIEQ